MPSLYLRCSHCGAEIVTRTKDLFIENAIVVCASCRGPAPLPDVFLPIITHILLREADIQIRNAIDSLPSWLRTRRFFE